MLSLVLGFVAPPAAMIVLQSLRDQGGVELNHISYALGFLSALFCVYVVPLRHCPSNPFLSQVLQRREAANKQYSIEATDIDDDYGLEHLWLNADLQPKTSWVNTGYWKTAQTASAACDDLFRHLLDFSGISKEDGFSILELGSACAETAYHLMSNYPDRCANWIGLTLSSIQAHVAKDRLARDAGRFRAADGSPKFKTFHADASKPHTWSADINRAVGSLRKPWLVAIEVLAHFEPSRKPAVAYAKRELGASLALIDTLRRSETTWSDRLKLRIALRLLDAPLKNLLTREEYIDMLVDCGYKRENISITTITEHVFKPYNDFVQEQGRRWQNLGGGKWDYNDFWLVGSVLNYFADTGLADSCMIIARA